jgi:hypothetical protein
LSSLENGNIISLIARTEKTSGGCHLYDRAFESKPDRYTWINNPKFHLRLQTPEPTSVKITLSRPEKVWKKQIAKSAVACMMGFYVYEGNATPSKECCLNELKFVPMNERAEVIQSLTFPRHWN